MRTIEVAHSKNWNSLWLELDSTLVVNGFKSNSEVPWMLRNRWNNCKYLLSNMNFYVSYVYREGNQCANSLASLGLSAIHLTFWNQIPPFISTSVIQNKIGWPIYRFVNYWGGLGYIPLLFFCSPSVFFFGMNLGVCSSCCSTSLLTKKKKMKCLCIKQFILSNYALNIDNNFCLYFLNIDNNFLSNLLTFTWSIYYI